LFGGDGVGGFGISTYLG